MEAKTEQDALVKARSILSLILQDLENVKTLAEAWGWSIEFENAAYDAVVAAIAKHEEETGFKLH